jgi:magnesium chelatase subunit I
VCDIYAALPSVTGKIELEYEGELKGAENVAQDLVKGALKQVFSRYFSDVDLQQIVDWFDLGGSLKLSDTTSARETFDQLQAIQGLVEKTASLGVKRRDELPLVVSGCEFILEGLHAMQKISRSEEKGYFASEKKRPEPFYDDKPGRARKTFN